jgi:16S rRNA (guanine527-N7)-methyltransferase
MSPAGMLEAGAAELGLTLPTPSKEKLLAYLALLGKWNRTYNLTAIRDPEKMLTHHLLDSLAVLPHLPAGTLADVGSGGGLPGVPLAIMQPERQVFLNDANSKKAAFLRQAQIELSLGNVRVHEGRSETWRPETRFQAVITRGFAALADFLSSCRHLVVDDGVLLAMKGAAPDAEIQALPRDAGEPKVIRLHPPFLGAERHLVLISERAK